MFVTFDRNTDTPGRITNIMSGPDPKDYGPILEKFGYEWFHCSGDPTTFPRPHLDYVDLSAVPEGEKPSQQHAKQRPTMELVDDEVSKITGFPKGSKVRIDYATTVVVEGIQIDDGVLEFDAPHPGTYVIHVECWPYFSGSMEIVR